MRITNVVIKLNYLIDQANKAQTEKSCREFQDKLDSLLFQAGELATEYLLSIGYSQGRIAHVLEAIENENTASYIQALSQRLQEIAERRTNGKKSK